VAEVVKGIVDIEINTGNAARELKALQQQINAFNLAINKGNTFQTAAAAKYSSELKDVINASRFFTAETVKMQTAAGALDSTLKKGQATLGSFFNAKFSRNSALFAETMGLAAERARTMQTQFIATSGSAKGMQEALAIRPLAAFNSEMAVAAQRSQILSTMFRQGTTQLINFGKNVQWAGRQLMVGFTLPLVSFGVVAGKTFRDLEKQTVAFKKVYGDIFTTPAELQGNLDAVMALGKEYTKYGIAVKDTVGLAAQAAAAGRRNKDLTDAVSESTRLATLGQMDQNEALKTTIALQSAFRLSGEDLSNAINFLNIVENQTVVSLQDLAAAIPKVAPVIVGLGGDVKDLSVFLAAMQEGGVSAEQGANALKSGLASLINPSRAAKETLGQLGINMDYIVNQNRGDLMGTVMAFSKALGTLDDFSRQQALEKIFGKYQYARLGALFDNLTRQGSQAQQVMDAAGFSVEQMAASADKELKTIEQSFGVQLTAAIEKFKLAIAPLGQMFLEMAIPVVNFFTKIVEGFNNLPDFTKRFAALATIITGLVIPAGTMFFGLLMNLSGTLAKLMQGVGIFTKGTLKGGILGGIQAVSQSMKYMSLQELDSALAAKQLGTATMSVNDALLAQVSSAQGARQAINGLADTYGILITRMAEAASISKFTLGTPGAAMQMAQTRNIKGGFPRKKFASGGVVPGTGNEDTVPAMLTPGEFVVTKKATNSIGTNFLKMLNGGKVGGYNNGGFFSDYSNMQNESSGSTNRYSKIISGQYDSPNVPFSQQPFEIGNAPSPLLNEMLKDLNLSHNTYTRFISPMPRFKPSVGSLAKSLIGNSKEYDFNNRLRTGTATRAEVGGFFLGNRRIHGGSSAIVSPFRYLLDEAGITDPGVEKQLGRTAHKILMQKVAAGQTVNDKMFSEIFNDAINRVGASVPDKQKLGLARAALGQQTGEARVSGRVAGLLKLLPNKIKKIPGMRRSTYVYTGSSGSIKFSPGQTRSSGGSGYQTMPQYEGYNKGHVQTFAKGGSVPSLLTPGEFVVGKQAAAKNRPFLEALNAGQVRNYATAGNVAERDQRYKNIYGSMASFKKGGLGTAGSVAAGASIPLMIAGQIMAQSSNQFAASIGNFVNKITPALFGLQLLGPLLPKLVAAIGFTGLGLGAAAALAGYGIYKFNKSVQELDGATVKLHDAMYGSEDQLKRFAEATGRRTLRQQAIEKAAASAGGAVSTEAQTFSSQFLQSDAGQKLLEDIRLAEKSGKDAVAALRSQLSRAMIAGILTKEEAKAIATDVGVELNNQKLAVGVVGSLTDLYDQDGNLIVGSLIRLNAEINGKITYGDLRSDAEAAYEASNPFIRFVGDRIPEYKELRIEATMANDTAKGLERSLLGTADSVVALQESFKNGDTTTEAYKEGMKQLATQAEGATNQSLQDLGVSFEDLDKKVKKYSAKGKNILTADTRKGGFLEDSLTKQEFAAVKMLQSLQKQSSKIFENALGKEVGQSVNDSILKQIAGGDAKKAADLWAQVLSGTVEPALLQAILRPIGDPETRKKIIELFSPSIDYSKGIQGSNTTTGDEPPPGVPGPKSALQELLDRITLTKQQTSAISGLIANGLNPEAAATLSAEEATQIYNKSKKEQQGIFKKIEDNSVRQRVLTAMGLSQDQKAINLNNLRIQGMNLEIAQNQKQIDQVARLNELDTRQVAIRQKALDILGKKEKSVNDLYNNRTKALDAVAQANERANQQQRNSIALASALTSGDFGAAASAAAQMTSDSASNQIQDAKTALETQRQAEISALTTDINGKLMTRAEIEAQIDTYNENIYQRTQSTLQYEDSIYTIRQNIAALEMQNDLTQQRIATTQVQIEASMSKQAGYAKSVRDYYSEVLAIMGKFPGVTTKKAAYGGSIQKLMYGGLPKGSTQSPPSLKFANGNIVPGTGMTDKVPALLTPGEFVVRKSVAEANMPLLKSLNSNVFGAGMSVGSPNISPIDATTSVSNVSAPVYNYNVNVNVADTNASPNEIADVVMNKIRMTKDRSVRGNRY
jgi:TP901 family phage tail tape measure protein